MCCNTPLVILPSGNAICNHYNITLRNVQEFLDGGLLQPLCEKSLMIYCQTKTDGTCQVGIFAAIDAADCMDRTVRPHENVTADVDKTTANAKHPYMNPIMLFHRDSAPLNEIIERIMLHDRPHQKKVSDITDEIHTIWIVNDVNVSQLRIMRVFTTCPVLIIWHIFHAINFVQDIVAIQNAFVDIKHLYIADGHHRTAALCRYRIQCTKLY